MNKRHKIGLSHIFPKKKIPVYMQKTPKSDAFSISWNCTALTHFQVVRSDPDVFGFDRIMVNLTSVKYSTVQTNIENI